MKAKPILLLHLLQIDYFFALNKKIKKLVPEALNKRNKKPVPEALGKTYLLIPKWYWAGRSL